MTKKLNTTNIQNELKQSRFFQKPAAQHPVVQTASEQDLHKNLSKNPSVRPSVSPSVSLDKETIEYLAFRVRDERKVRVGADLPERWKVRLDELAHEHTVGKYDLLTYIIASFLGEV